MVTQSPGFSIQLNRLHRAFTYRKKPSTSCQVTNINKALSKLKFQLQSQPRTPKQHLNSMHTKRVFDENRTNETDTYARFSTPLNLSMRLSETRPLGSRSPSRRVSRISACKHSCAKGGTNAVHSPGIPAKQKDEDNFYGMEHGVLKHGN